MTGKTYTQEEVDEIVKGLKDNKDDLLREKRTLQDKLKEFDGIDLAKVKGLQDLGDIDLKSVKELMKHLETDNEAKLIASGKVSEVVNARVEKKLTEMDKAIKEANEKAATLAQRNDVLGRRLVEQSLLRAASEAGILPMAVPDMLIQGERLFSLSENEVPVQKVEGQVVFGSDGKTPFSPVDWLSGIKEQKPHWFAPGNAGSPTPQGDQGAGGRGTMKRAEFMKLSPRDQAAAVEKNEIVD